MTALELLIDEGLSRGHHPPAVWSARWTTTFTPRTSGEHRLSLDVSGLTVLRIGDLGELENEGRDLSIVQHAVVA